MGQCHRLLGRSRFVFRAALLLRNQCRRLIACHLSEGFDFRVNGEAWLAAQAAPRSLVFVDVGANIGEWTHQFLQGAPAGARGFLYDPSECVFDKLRHRFKDCGGVEVIRAFMSDRAGEIPFFEEPGAGETSSFSAKHSRTDAVKKTVPATTLDLEAKARGWARIDFLKIDAEGYDLHVLRGGIGLLSGQKIGIVQFEYNAQWASAGSTLSAAYELLESSRYEVYLLKSGGLFKLDLALCGEYFEYSNFVALSPEALPYFLTHLKGGL